MYQAGDIILTRFPYSDLENFKIRPALVIANSGICKFDDCIILGITSQQLKNSKLEVKISNRDLENGSLPQDSFVRIAKIATLETSLILKKVAFLEAKKQKEVLQKFCQVVSLIHKF